MIEEAKELNAMQDWCKDKDNIAYLWALALLGGYAMVSRRRGFPYLTILTRKRPVAFQLVGKVKNIKQ